MLLENISECALFSVQQDDDFTVIIKTSKFIKYCEFNNSCMGCNMEAIEKMSCSISLSAKEDLGEVEVSMLGTMPNADTVALGFVFSWVGSWYYKELWFYHQG